MTQGERVRAVRKSEKINMTLEKFGEKLGLQKSAVSKIERGDTSLTDANIKNICREFNVDYIWLTTGEGNMFVELPPEDEVGIWVSQLIEERNNPLFDIILETMRTFNQLTPEDQKIVSSYCEQLLHNLKDKKES